MLTAGGAKGKKAAEYRSERNMAGGGGGLFGRGKRGELGFGRNREKREPTRKTNYDVNPEKNQGGGVFFVPKKY